jgi:hypothetical protein
MQSGFVGISEYETHKLAKCHKESIVAWASAAQDRVTIITAAE